MRVPGPVLRKGDNPTVQTGAMGPQGTVTRKERSRPCRRTIFGISPRFRSSSGVFDPAEGSWPASASLVGSAARPAHANVGQVRGDSAVVLLATFIRGRISLPVSDMADFIRLVHLRSDTTHRLCRTWLISPNSPNFEAKLLAMSQTAIGEIAPDLPRRPAPTDWSAPVGLRGRFRAGLRRNPWPWRSP